MNTAKNKGSRGEYEVRDMLQEIVNSVYSEWNRTIVSGIGIIQPPTLKRNLEQTRSGGYDIEGLDWMALEVKRVEKENAYWIETWWDQAKVSGKVSGREPILMHRRNWQDWKVRMYGYLIAEDKPGGLRIQLPVDINLTGFLAYFRIRAMSELRKKEVR